MVREISVNELWGLQKQI